MALQRRTKRALGTGIGASYLVATFFSVFLNPVIMFILIILPVVVIFLCGIGVCIYDMWEWINEPEEEDE